MKKRIYFDLIIILLLVYGCIMAFRWAGLSLADRLVANDTTLTSGISEEWDTYNISPLKQLDTEFYKSNDMNLVFNNS